MSLYGAFLASRRGAKEWTMTDPRTAALAVAIPDALRAVNIPDDKRDGYGMVAEVMAAAILSALPPDWCGHDDLAVHERDLAQIERDEAIARLRRIEEAARALNVDEDGESDFDLILLMLRKGGILGTTMQHVLALRAALEEKP
jgi:hypothetical protein